MNSNLLALVENSLNTNFPAGSQIAIGFGQVFVADRTGTNIFDLSTLIAIEFDGEMESAMETRIRTQNSSGTSFAGNQTLDLTLSATLAYDDTAFTTGDGTHTTFQFKGLMTVKQVLNLKTNGAKVNIEFQGTGGGPIRGVDTILTGTIKVKAAGGQAAG